MTHPTTTHGIHKKLNYWTILMEWAAKKDQKSQIAKLKHEQKRTRWWTRLQNAELCCLKLDLHVICTRSFRLNNDVTPIGLNGSFSSFFLYAQQKNSQTTNIHDNEKRQNRKKTSVAVISIILFALLVISFTPSFAASLLPSISHSF